ncbi:MAG TPA: ester cyclase [Candidatus Tectomicrobia bacterium]
MTSAANKALIRRLYQQVFADWNLDVIDELFDPTFRVSPSFPPGPEGVKQFYARLRAAFPDLRYVVNDIIAEEDKVVVRWTWHCTHRGTFRGIPPTGRQASVTGMAIYRVANGKCVERWVNLNMLGLLEQLGAGLDNPGPA